MRIIALAILAASLSVPAAAAPATGADATKPEKPKKEKKICKHISTTESRMGTTACKTAEEWEQDPTDAAGKIGYRR